jgi:hypothetical protein
MRADLWPVSLKPALSGPQPTLKVGQSAAGMTEHDIGVHQLQDIIV